MSFAHNVGGRRLQSSSSASFFLPLRGSLVPCQYGAGPNQPPRNASLHRSALPLWEAPELLEHKTGNGVEHALGRANPET